MTSKFNRTCINDLCSKIYSGGTPKSTNLDYYNGDIPWLNTKEVNYRRIYNTEKNITKLGYNNSSAKWVPENSIIVAMYGATAGRCAISKIPLTTNQACCNLIIDDKKADYNYVYYWLCYYYDKLFNLANGGAQQNLNSQNIKDFCIYIPDITEQKSISKPLSLIDDKIELNKKIVLNLQSFIMQYFLHLFIESDNDWKEGHFNDLVDLTIGGDWGKSELQGNFNKQVFCIRGADIPEIKEGSRGKMPVRFILQKNFKNKKLTQGDIVIEISGGSPTQSTGRTALITEDLLKKYNGEMICTNFCRALKPKKGYSNYLYYYLQYLYDKGLFFSYENGTTGIKNLDLANFLNIEEIKIPPLDVCEKFDRFCNLLMKKIVISSSENEYLQNLLKNLLYKSFSRFNSEF